MHAPHLVFIHRSALPPVNIMNFLSKHIRWEEIRVVRFSQIRFVEENEKIMEHNLMRSAHPICLFSIKKIDLKNGEREEEIV